MVQFINTNSPAGQYFTVAASQEDQVLGNVGATGDYLAGLLVIPATATPGAISVADGATDVIIIPAGTTIQSYYIPINAYSKTGTWNVTTGAAVSVFATGQFT
jgi:hypothetical protein